MLPNKGMFKEGNPGRPKGIVEKRSRYFDVIERLEKMGHDPVNALILMAKDEGQDPKIRLKANCELMARIAPVLKAIEHKGDSEINNELKELKEKMYEELEKYKRDH